MHELTLVQALEAILEASDVPKGQGTSIEAMMFAWREARRRIRQLSSAAAIANLPVKIRRVGELEGYDLWMEREDLPADPQGAPLLANLEIRIGACESCGRRLDYVGERGAWHCTNVECARSARRRPATPDPYPPRHYRPFSA